MKIMLLLATICATLSAHADFYVSYNSAVSDKHRTEQDEIIAVLPVDGTLQLVLRNWHSAPAIMRFDTASLTNFGLSVGTVSEILTLAKTSGRHVTLNADLTESEDQKFVTISKINDLVIGK